MNQQDLLWRDLFSRLLLQRERPLPSSVFSAVLLAMEAGRTQETATRPLNASGSRLVGVRNSTE